MLIKVWPRAAIAALGTWHARSKSSCWELSYLKLDLPRLQRCAWESFDSKAATKDDNLMDSSFSPSSCAGIPQWGVMTFVYDESWNSTHIGLSYQIKEGMWFSQKHGASLPPKMVKRSLVEKLPKYGNSPPPPPPPPHLTTSHHISPNRTSSHRITSHHTTAHLLL